VKQTHVDENLEDIGLSTFLEFKNTCLKKHKASTVPV
jgi:hypothetical protein